MFNYKNAIENRVMETKNTLNVSSVSISHHSKIKELSDGNNNWKLNPKKPLSHESHHFWVMGDGNKVMNYGNMKSKHPLNPIWFEQRSSPKFECSSTQNWFLECLLASIIWTNVKLRLS